MEQNVADVVDDDDDDDDDDDSSTYVLRGISYVEGEE